MRAHRLAAMLTTLALTPGLGVAADNERLMDPGDAVPGHAGMTYLDLAKIAVPDLALNPDDHRVEGHLVTPPRHIAGHDLDGDPPDPVVLGSMEDRRIMVGGHKRLVLLTDLGADPDRAQGMALMVLFDDEGPTPTVLDVADVAMDKDTFLATQQSVQPLGPGDSALVVYSEHDDSDLTFGHYMIVSPVGDRLAMVDRFDLTSEQLCSWRGVESAHFSTAPDPGRPYRRLEVRVRAVFERTHQDGCNDEHVVKAQTRVFHAAYRWNAATGAFVTAETNLQGLDALNSHAF